MKKTLFLFPFAFIIGSCKYFEKQVPDEDKLLQQRLEQINWKQVSSYPSVSECDAITDKKLKRDCFFSTMARLVQEKLGADTIAMLHPCMDTINMKVTVYPDSKIVFEPQFPADSTTYNRAKFDSIIKSRLVDFPKVEPAQKEGIPVTSQFIIPVVLDVAQ